MSKEILSYSFKKIAYVAVWLALRTNMISLLIQNTRSKDENNNDTAIVISIR